MCTQILLDKETLAKTIDEEFEGINFKDCVIKQEAPKIILNKEKMGPNYFLVGGPYQNYA